MNDDIFNRVLWWMFDKLFAPAILLLMLGAVIIAGVCIHGWWIDKQEAEIHKNDPLVSAYVIKLTHYAAYQSTALVGKMMVTTNHPEEWAATVAGYTQRGATRIETYSVKPGWWAAAKEGDRWP